MDRTATIIGGGISGLALARALRRDRWQVAILERAHRLPSTGTMLGMWPAAIRALDAVGAGEAVRGAAVRVDASTVRAGVFTPSGRVLASMPGATDISLVSRPELLAILADGLDVTFGCRVESDDPAPDTTLVVGADGLFSHTRDRLFDERYRAVGLEAVVWRGTIDGSVAEYGETWAPGALFGMTPAGPGRTNWYACLRGTGIRSVPQLPHLREAFGGWHAGVGDVLDRIREDDILHHELFESPRLPSYVRGNTALVGDAAHGMGPFLGRGACEALVDAAALGRCLAEAETVAGGLAAYDRARRPPTRRLVRQSRLMGRVAMARTGSGARNLALGAVGGILGRRTGHASRPGNL